MRILSLGAAATVASLAALAAPADAAEPEITLRIQNLFSAESLPGQNAAQFFDDLEVMSAGRIKVEPFYSSAVVKSVETFDAVVNGILDGDMTQPSYQTGKDPAFQFVGDLMGGYDTPWQLYAFFYNGGGLELARELYAEYDMRLVGWWIHGQEALSSSRPLDGVASLEGWKFRSPPGMETTIFANMGASPVVMDFTEIFTAMESGVIDGADASNLAVNKSLGIYDVVDHATYPGFHSMPADHFAIRLETWDALPDDLKRIVDVAWQKHAFQNSLSHAIEIDKTANALREAGATLHDWPAEDRAAFREAAVTAWDEYATSEMAKKFVTRHKEFLGRIGLLD
ncbi:TRAP transporter substrate-binding protein [Acuticoccus mangrovi]|uniref:TRAP transporter substrate-binding protein n=1 Tax=Acuticoccus mangrovi TaxID=2796142 RepID=A0A934IJF4_9HYPH|nr:TRAP transporter substrate-binding protein [Acuticoccus mangrovi]MBJ3776116.1 TRAP transporter substrate-binding protein [Acuticoccus mangrovi]